MKFFERATSSMAALGSIDVSPSFQIASQDAKLEGNNRGANTPGPALPPLFQLLSGPFAGTGLNTIFRPHSDNILELNLINETLTFSPNIGAIPNRGLSPQADITLGGIPYLQVVNDVTNTQTGRNDGTASGIHFEPGMFLHVPSTNSNPVLGATVNRLGSIPHGATINAQAIEPTTSFTTAPTFPVVDITPFAIGNPSQKIPFSSQTVSSNDANRLPSDLTKFNQTGFITQAILSDPNTILRQQAANQNIVNTFLFTLSTVPNAKNITGGGTDSDSFLTGSTSGTNGGVPPNPNAFAFQMNATFWIETVNWTITVPPTKSGQNVILQPIAPNPKVALPSFSVTPPKDITTATNVTGQSTQIQYSQLVILNFNGLSWPHASVNTLAQQGNIAVPASAFN